MASIERSQAWMCGLGILLILCALGVSGEQAADEAQEVPWQTIQQEVSWSFVVVHFHLKKSEHPSADGEDRYDSEQRAAMEYILDKNTVETVGVILSESGEVLTLERQPQLSEVVDHITVRGWDGAVVPAQADRLLTKAPGRIVRLAEALPEEWRALSFAELAETPTPEMRLFVAALGIDEQQRISIKPCGYGLTWGGETTGHSLQLPNFYHVGVLCSAAGRPVGVTIQREIDLGPAGTIWRGGDILADPGISVEQQRQLEGRLKKEFAEHVYEITVTFRPQSREDGYDFPGRYRYEGPYSRRGSQERLLYGLGFASAKLLVPEILSAEMVAGIDTISVEIDGRQVPARFDGALQECSAMVIGLEEGELPRTMAFAGEATVARIKPFWGVSVREMAGKDVRVRYTRWIEKRQGYADKWYPVLDRSVRVGSWLVDDQGRLAGLCGRMRRAQDRLRPYLLASRYGSYRSPSYFASEYMGGGMGYEPYPRGSTRKLFEGAELARLLDNLPAGYDEHIRHMTKDEQKRRVWLGVEYTALSKEMVKQMDLREPTEDGRLGMMINRVYPGSPAARAGLVEGNILLTLAVPEAPWPIELTVNERDDYDMPDYDEADIPREFEAMGLRMPRRRPWPSRGNPLTQMLADIGLGTRVSIRYIHNGQIEEKEFEIERAPRDMLSAAKYKNEELGLTVKDLTYEVRAGLHLDESERAVVITEVEQGTAAALARINRFELIRAVDGQPVDDVEVFEKLLADAQEAEKESVRLTVEYMGKTRLADLKFDAQGAPGLLKSLLPGLP
ncbi:MAG: hypothetical protein JSW27_18800 [Phycisphaerales bacterium]|nr:MAG: hypothetical protein JSW27_18800 [Phycisphaerales bacterium]